MVMAIAIALTSRLQKLARSRRRLSQLHGKNLKEHPVHTGRIGWKNIMKIRRTILLRLAIAGFAALPMLALAHPVADSDSSTTVALATPPALPDLTYTRPTEKTKLRN